MMVLEDDESGFSCILKISSNEGCPDELAYHLAILTMMFWR